MTPLNDARLCGACSWQAASEAPAAAHGTVTGAARLLTARGRAASGVVATSDDGELLVEGEP